MPKISKLSPKYWDYLNSILEKKVLFAEGTTSAGKTTVSILGFLTAVRESPVKHHIIAGLDKGTIEKNIINKPYGLLDQTGDLAEYNGNGTSRESIPHIIFNPNGGEKIIYVLGYDDRKRWKKALGAQYGVLYIDEINIADMEFVREAMMRCDKVIGTLNPDDPALPVYKEFINHSRPNPKWADSEPVEILDELTETPKDGWEHWFFTFDDNEALTEEKKQTIIANVPEDTKLWKNKILGLRGRATGLVFSNFSDSNVISASDAKQMRFDRFSLGVDTAYSAKSADTIAFVFMGISRTHGVTVLSERVFNNADRHEPLAPSDVVRELVAFADYCRVMWGDFRNMFIDSADQATITEASKYKRNNGSIYIFNPAYKDMKVMDRINLQLGWIAKDQFRVVDDCKECIRELGVYAWKEDKNEPEDKNDHTVNACQYGWLPYVAEIGTTGQEMAL